MKFLILTYQSELVNNNNFELINLLSAKYAYFLKKYLIKHNPKIEIDCDELPLNDKTISSTNFMSKRDCFYDNCIITVYRGIDLLDKETFECLRKKITNKIIVISETSKITGREDINLFFLGKIKNNCSRISWMADSDFLYPEKDLSKLTILVDHNLNNNYKEASGFLPNKNLTEFVLMSLLNLKNKSNKIITGIYRKKPVEILHIGEKSIYKIDSINDIQLKQNNMDYSDLYRYYRRADIYICTNPSQIGTELVDVSMAGCLVVTFEKFVDMSLISKINHYIIPSVQVKDNCIDWNTIINKLDRHGTHNLIKNRLTYVNTVNKIMQLTNKKNKIAICFSGAIRSFDRCIPSITKYFLNNLPGADIYLHMWTFNDNNDEKTNSINYNFKWRKDNSDIYKIINILKPVKYEITEYNLEWEKIILEESGIDVDLFDDDTKKNYGFNCCSMYWKILKCFELVEDYSLDNNINYDLVIRARLDFIWEDHIYINNFVLSDDTVNLIQDKYATHSKLITNDKFFAGSYECMRTMCNIFKKLKYYQQKNIAIEGQTINETHIRENNLQHNWIGHKDTYYKHMIRHKIILKNIKIQININNNQLTNELVYFLLEEGYYVNVISGYVENYNLLYDNYINLMNNSDIIIKNTQNNIFEIIKNNKKIVINIDESIITLIYKKKYTILIDFIMSLIINIDDLRILPEYTFNSVNLIKNINKGENLIYKYLDRGYYDSKLIEYKKNIYYIEFNNSTCNVDRNSFKIKNIVFYYEKNILPINY